ncbi:HAUS augmin-like complex subunit 7 isoform X2 [Stylophora pistillata]|uniref:HAUS augmin-like complex subunit 7 isoform X2 n=1 Tax=Stylophora pistillata TaxID=50429 RepID=UPI000C039520|nr:HAUS augmin-like complex subunit 7 isoform X2 [Stylophora pistillata]
MAAAVKDRLSHFRSKLEELDCPYLGGVEESWIEELLFKPGEPRLRLLQWAVGKFDPVIYNMLENQQSKALGRNDSRIQKLLFACHLLGLCKSDDIDLVQGNKSRNKQAVFWENLLDLIGTIESSGQISHFTTPVRTASLQSGTPFSLEEQFRSDCYFFDGLCRQEDLQNVFRSKVQLYPPDLMKTTSGLENKKIPDEKQLMSVTEKLLSELEEQSKQLDELRESAPLCDADAITVEKVSKTLSLSLTTMAQVVSGFLHCFETEMKPWSKRPAPVLSVGPAFSRVHRLLSRYTELIQNLGTIKRSYSEICHDGKDKIFTRQKDDTGLNPAELKTLQGCLGVLEESLQRLREEGR